MFSRLVALVVIMLVVAPNARSQDKDADGLTDEQEKVLGSHVDKPEQFKLIAENPVRPEKNRRPTYDGSKDLVKVEFCHVGEDRYLWRVTMAEAPNLKDTVLHLYLDADSDKTTGRKDRGNEYMASVVGGKGQCLQYAPDGKLSTGPKVVYVVQGNAVIMSSDVKLGRDDKGIRYSIDVLCHNIAKPGEKTKMSDYLKLMVKEFPVRPGTVPERVKKK